MHRSPETIGAVVLTVLLMPFTSCHHSAPPPVAPEPRHNLGWTWGTWTGHRIGRESSPMTLEVRPILGGAGQTREIEIPTDDGAYRGFAVEAFDVGRAVWVRQYVNESRGTFATYECDDPTRNPAIWRSVTPGRTRESRLTSEHSPPDRWSRTMEISTDGEPWRVLWRDELVREH